MAPGSQNRIIMKKTVLQRGNLIIHAHNVVTLLIQMHKIKTLNSLKIQTANQDVKYVKIIE